MSTIQLANNPNTPGAFLAPVGSSHTGSFIIMPDGSWFDASQIGPNGQVTLQPPPSGWQNTPTGITLTSTAGGYSGGPNTNTAAVQSNAGTPTYSPASSGLSAQIIDNSTGVSGVLYAGNRYTLTIKGGAPGALVSVTSGTYQQKFGNADANGNFVLSDITPTNLVGQNTQVWNVGGQNVTVTFTIVAPVSVNPTQVTTTPSTNLPAGSGSNSSSSANNSGTGNPGGTTNVNQSTAAATGGSTDILASLEADTVMGIPLIDLTIGAIGLLAISKMFGGRR